MDITQQNRRSFIKTAATGTLATLSLTQIVTSAFAAENVKSIKLKKGDTILFQGDSITDGNRDRNPPKYNIDNADRKGPYNDFNVLGASYVFSVASELLYKNPSHNFKIFNRGNGGEKVFQLAARWDEDCFKLKPDVLSILIGVNDFWHTFYDYKGTIEIYRKDFKALIERTKQTLPDVKLVIGEPFAIKGGQAITDKWYPAFTEYQAAARELAGQFGAVFIPYQSVFDKALAVAPGNYWSFDGVHPSIPGAVLMREAWLKAVNV